MDAQTLGLLSAAGAGLEASGPSRMPVSMGQVLSRGLLGGINAYQGAQDREMRQGLLGLQALQLQTALSQAAQKQQAIQAYGQSLPEDQRAIFMANPEAYIGAKTKAMEPFSLRPGEQRFANGQPIATAPESFTLSPGQVRMTGGQQVATVPEKPETAQDANGVLRYRTGPNVGQIVPGFEAQKTPEGFTRKPDGTLQIDPGFLAGKTSIANAGATRVQTNVANYTPASEAAQRDFMDKSAKSYEALQSAPSMLQNLSKARQIVASGNPFIGSFGAQKAAIAQFFNNNFGTSIAPDAVANVGELKNRLFQQIADGLKKMDASPSQLQQQIMMDALGNINTDPKALQKILNVTEEIIRSKVAIHNQAVRSAESRGVKFPFDPVIGLDQPAAQSGPSNGVVDFGSLK